jgi:hypothetical protein
MSSIRLKCLKVKQPFASMIVCGDKPWELRLTSTNIRERIAIGSTKTKVVIGYVTIIDCFPMTVNALKKYGDQLHHAAAFVDDYAKGRERLYVWVLDDAVVEKKPYPYSFSTGSWCFASGGLVS